MTKLALEQQELLFANDCKLINLRYEYHGYTGTEKWAIVTELAEEELWVKYPDVIRRYTPFILLSMAQGEVITEYQNYEASFKLGHWSSFTFFRIFETFSVVELFLKLLCVVSPVLVDYMAVNIGNHIHSGVSRVALNRFHIAAVPFQLVGYTCVTEALLSHNPCLAQYEYSLPFSF